MIQRSTHVLCEHTKWKGGSDLGSVHKYFGGGGWAIENFCRQTFLTPPFASRQNFLNPPSTCVKTFLTPPPIATCIISVSFFNTNLFCMHHRCTSITGNHLTDSAKPSFMDKPVARFFNYSCIRAQLSRLVVPLPIIPVLVILIRIQKFVYLYPRTRSRTRTRDS